MKIKIIKKANYLFFGVLSVLVAVPVALSMWSNFENADFDHTQLAGKLITTKKDSSSGLQKEDVVQSEEKKEEIQQSVIVDSFAANDSDQEDLPKEEGAQQAEKAEEEQNAPFSFVAIGDSESYKEQTGHNKSLAALLAKASSHKPNFALFTGDIISTSDTTLRGNKQRITSVKRVIEKYFNNYYIAFGKHDTECGTGCVDAWNEIFFNKESNSKEDRKLFFSFDYQNTHFVLLSSDYPLKHSVDKEQLAWLEEDLQNNSRKNTIVVQHVPPVTFFEKSAKDCHDMSCVPQVKNKLMSLFKKYKVDCVISGHEHAFDHKIVDEIDFVLSGNVGNKPRYKGVIKGDIYSHFFIDDKKITLKAFNLKGKLIREIKIK